VQHELNPSIAGIAAGDTCLQFGSDRTDCTMSLREFVFRVGLYVSDNL